MMANKMLFASATATERNVDRMVERLASQIEAQIDEQPLDFGLIFLSPHFTLGAMQIVNQLTMALRLRVLLGCTGEGVIGRAVEIENEPAITLVVGHLPAVELVPFTLEPLDWQDMLEDEALFRQVISVPEASKLFVLLADPFSTPVDQVLTAFNTYHAGVPIIGGMASGARSRGGNVMISNNRLLTRGAVGVAFAGAVEVDVIVSQGCRPIGEPMTVTRAERNMIYSLEGEPPLLRLQRMLEWVPEADRELLKENGLFVGRAINQDQKVLGRGDFLIRGLMGVDEQSGAIAVGDYLQVGETIQLHVRDASTAEEDLEMMLSPQMFFGAPSGALLFSCNGRGTRLYDHPNGDIATIQSILGGVDLAGFFCAGELGPIGGKNFLHGHTASMALFRPTETTPAD